MAKSELPPNRPPPGLIAAAQKIFKQRETARLDFVERYGHIRPPMALKHQGEAFAVVGGTIYKSTNPHGYSFLHLIHDHALIFFGEAMLKAEEKKPFDLRHPALQWMQSYWENRARLEAEGSTAPHASRNGAGASWTRFTYDLFTIRDNADLEAALRKRLLDPVAFQGARYELWVAALCVAAGFDLQFEDDSDGSRTHPEFIGTDKFSSLRIAVEAKSRQRKGVKGFSGGKDEMPGASVGARNLVTDALKKKSDLPLYVFVDLNLPPGPEEKRKEWAAELTQMMTDLTAEGYSERSSGNAFFFTNDPSHYMLDQPVGGPEDNLWFEPFYSATPRVNHPDPDPFKRLVKAWGQRVSPPEDFPAFSNLQWTPE